MAKRLNMFVLAALLILVGAIFEVSEAYTTHIVGDSTGWRIPPGGAATYATWASQQTFAVGDVLVFNFAKGTHDVVMVTKSAYKSCSAASPIASTTTAASILLSSGDQYFICSFSGHCDAGQKLTVTVSAANSTAATPPVSTATPPPPPSAATSLVATALLMAFLLSLALVFLH